MAAQGAGGIDGDQTGSTTSGVSNGLLGMMLFVVAEVMLFAGLISAFAIVKASAMVWPPPDQPRLPVEATLFNTVVLLASGYFLYVAHRHFRRGDRENMQKAMWRAFGLGAFFVVFQGFEWVQLIGQGLTITSSSLGSFFFLIVGMHALHALGALTLLGIAVRRLRSGFITASLFGATEALWFFVVGAWPILYATVYW